MNQNTEAVNVVWLNLDLSTLAIDDLSTLLRPWELQRASRYTSSTQQRRAIVRMARRRQILAKIFGADPQEIAFEETSSGKLFLDSSLKSDIDFSSSHCGDVGVFAYVKGRKLGVDVEAVSNLHGSKDFLATIATQDEIGEFNAFTPEEKVRARLRLWTRKEALLKATGEGIGAGLRHVSVPLSETAHGLFFRSVNEGPPWLLYELDCPRQDLNAALVISTVDNNRITPLVNVIHV